MKGNLQTFPSPTDIAIHDMRNSRPLPHVPRSVSCDVVAISGSYITKIEGFNQTNLFFTLGFCNELVLP